MDDADAALAAEQLEVKNPFPTPPTYWIRYTPENSRLLGLLKEKISQGDDWSRTKGDNSEEVPVDQEALLPDEPLLPSFPLLELEPPRLEWILEQEEYESFAEKHQVLENLESLSTTLTSLTQTNEIAQPFPSKTDYNLEPGSDPRPHLRQLLVSLLDAYHKLLSSVLEPVPSGYHHPPPGWSGEAEEAKKPGGGIVWPPPLNWEATLGWMETLVINLGGLVNEFRPIQARMALESMTQRQIDIRREETKIIHGKCDELERTLADLRAKTSTLLPLTEMVVKPPIPDSPPVQEGLIGADTIPAEIVSSSRAPIPILTIEDLIAWSQEGLP